MKDKQGTQELSPLAGGTLKGAKTATKTNWSLADELPLVIFYNGEQFGVMMLTRADLEDFALGFSLTEHIISRASDIREIRFEEIGDGLAVNILVSEAALEIARSRKRAIKGGSSCGICGARTLETALPKLARVRGMVPDADIALSAIDSLMEKQVFFLRNFSTHAAALIDAAGKITLLREDVGRHNALDKLVGAMAARDLSGRDGFLVLTSRFSVEMVQKANVADFAFVASLSAPTALALKIATQSGMTIATKSENALMVFD